MFHEKYVALGAITRINPIMPFGMLAVILQGVVISYFYPLFYKHVGGGNSILRGIQYSLFMGIMVWTVMVFATAAKFKIEPVFDFVLLGTIFQLIQFVVVGIGIGLVYGKKVKCSTNFVKRATRR